MLISDEIFDETFDIHADDPYEKSQFFRNKLSEIGKIMEKKNEMWTDGPEHRSVLEFDVVEVLDPYSHVSAIFSMNGSKESKLLQISAKIKITTEIKEKGFFSAAFVEYYMKTSYATISNMCKSKAHIFKNEVESLFRETHKKINSG